MSTRMTEQEREVFLADMHVGIVCVTEEDRGPLAVPVWYAYNPGGELWFSTAIQSKKVRLIKKAGRLSLCVQNETPPYQYVTVEGPVISIEPMDIERDLKPIAIRYLGYEQGENYIKSYPNNPGGGSVIIKMRPERWFSADYSKSMS